MLKTTEERMKIVNQILFGSGGMRIIRPLAGVENRMTGGACTGYRIKINNLSYRGAWLSTIEDVRLTVNGEDVDRDNISVELNGVLYPVDSLEGHTAVFWGLEDDCFLSVNKVGGLAAGKHMIEVAIVKRRDFGHSYGEGEEGYDQAIEFLNPGTLTDKEEFEIRKAKEEKE